MRYPQAIWAILLGFPLETRLWLREMNLSVKVWEPSHPPKEKLPTLKQLRKGSFAAQIRLQPVKEKQIFPSNNSTTLCWVVPCSGIQAWLPAGKTLLILGLRPQLPKHPETNTINRIYGVNRVNTLPVQLLQPPEYETRIRIWKKCWLTKIKIKTKMLPLKSKSWIKS